MNVVKMFSMIRMNQNNDAEYLPHLRKFLPGESVDVHDWPV